MTQQQKTNLLKNFVTNGNSSAKTLNICDDCNDKKDISIKIFHVDNSAECCFGGIFVYEPTASKDSAVRIDMVSNKLVDAFYGPMKIYSSMFMHIFDVEFSRNLVYVDGYSCCFVI